MIEVGIIFGHYNKKIEGSFKEFAEIMLFYFKFFQLVLNEHFCNFIFPLSDHLFFSLFKMFNKFLFIHNRYSQLLCLVKLRTGIFPCQNEISILTYRGSNFPSI